MFYRKYKNEVVNIMLILTFFIFSLYISTKEDDFVFAEGIRRYDGLVGWISFFSQNWGGRIIPQGLLVVLLQLPEWIFAFINALMWCLLLNYMCKVFIGIREKAKREKDALIFFEAAIAIFVFLPNEMIASALFWKCANVLYLWGTACTLIAIYPFVCILRGDNVKNSDYLLSIICSIYASSFEQDAVLMCFIMFSMLLILVVEKRANSIIAVITFLAIVFSLFFILMPGNHKRFSAEILRWYQMYDMYSFQDKLLMGINYAVQGIEENIPVLLAVLSGLLFEMIVKCDKDKTLKILSFFLFIFFIANCIHRLGTIYDGDKYLLGRLFELYPVENADFNISFFSMVKEYINVIACALLGCELLLYKQKGFDITSFLFYVGGLGTMIMMGFSPTIHASGTRPMFIGCFFVLCTLMSVISTMLFNNISKCK